MGIFVMFVLGLLALIIWLIPVLKIANSNRTHGGEKVAWVLVTAFVFWFAWILYLFIAPIDKSQPNSNGRL